VFSDIYFHPDHLYNRSKASHAKEQRNLLNAIAAFELKIQRFNYPFNETVKLFVFLTDAIFGSMVVQDLNMAKMQSKLNTANDIEKILKDYIPSFPIYGTIDLQSDIPPYNFKKSTNIN